VAPAEKDGQVLKTKAKKKKKSRRRRRNQGLEEKQEKTKTAAERHYTKVGLNLQPPTGQIQKLVPLTLHKPSYLGPPVVAAHGRLSIN